MFGSVMALAMVDILEAAASGLVQRGKYKPTKLMNELKAEEDLEYDKFLRSDLTAQARENILQDPAIDMNVVVRQRPFCRTARLPAQARYLGIMSDNNVHASPIISYTNYEMGIPTEVAKRTPNPDTAMRLTYDTPHDARGCPVPLNQDFKDLYLVTPGDGWQSITVPNKREKEYYLASAKEPLKGLVMLVLTTCGWHCPPGDLREDSFLTGAIEVEVNGLKATNVSSAWGGIFLKHGDNDVYFPANAQGQYEIRARVTEEGASYMRLSGISIW
jgi:hypothetical protein